MATLASKLNRDLERLYDRRRSEAVRLRDERILSLYRQYPELQALDRAVTRAGIARLCAESRDHAAASRQDPATGTADDRFTDKPEIAGQPSGSLSAPAGREEQDPVFAGRTAAAGSVLDDGEAARAFEAAVARRDAFLLRNGIDISYLNPVYFCSACKDTGNIGGRVCPCRNRAVQSILPAYFPDPMDKNAVFSNFNLNLFDNHPSGGEDTLSPRARMSAYVNMATTYAAHFRRVEDRNLFFSGAPGTGKTFLMQCVGHRLIEDGWHVIYVTAPSLFDMMARYRRQQLSFRPDPAQLDEAAMVYDALLSWDLLLVDDLGTEPLTQEAFAQLLTLLDARQSRGLATVIASNLTVRDILMKYDRRLASRIEGNYLTYNFPSQDVRLRHRRRRLEAQEPR